MQKCMSFNDAEIVSVKGNDYRIHIGYMDDDKIKSVCITLSKMSTYAKSDDGETKWMYFLIEDNKLLKKYNDIWNKVSNSIKKGFDSEPIYNKKCMKTKVKSFGNEATDFHDEEIPRVDYNYFCLE